jgi:hypothetical protein
MDLTVVVASLEARHTITACLDRLATACAGLEHEILVCDASTDGTIDCLRGRGGAEQVCSCPPGTLAPALWSAGITRARGRVVALTTGHCLVGATWAFALVGAIDAGAAGAGGPFRLAAGTGPTDWAVFYLRYAAFLPGVMGLGRIDTELAGDNAAYRRADLVRHADVYAQGFWELDMHRVIRAEGGWLEAVPDAVCEFGRAFPFLAVARHRFAHGQHSGASRASQGVRPAWQIVAGAPLVPFVLAARAAGRVGRDGGSWRFWVALPWFLALASCWAAGEAVGAWRRGTRSSWRP